MKAAVLYADRDIRFGDAPQPAIAPDEVLVETGCAGICGTDLHIYRGEFHERVPFPAIQGHEFGGHIVDIGSNVRGWRRGDRVAGDPILSCHSCPACLAGQINCCQSLKLLGVDLNGGFGQFVAVPQHRLFALPESVPMAYAPMVEMYGLGCHVLRRGMVQPGETVAILGAGKLGLSVLDVLCHSANPSTTFISDVQPFRLTTAKRLGADHAIDLTAEDPVSRVLDVTQGRGVDVVIEAVGHYHEVPGREPPLQQAVRMIRNGGRIVTAGLGEQSTPVHFKTLVIKEAQLIASRVTLGEFPQAIRLMAKGLLHPDLLVTHQLPLADATAAFAQVDREDPATIKVVMRVAS
jgi:L-gulonate 5-dehydrogenase